VSRLKTKKDGGACGWNKKGGRTCRRQCRGGTAHTRLCEGGVGRSTIVTGQKLRAGDLQTDLQAAKQELGSTIEVLLDRERELESGQEYHAAQILSYEKKKASTATKLESTNKEIKV